MRLAGFPLAFALILLVKWDTLREPPFWDTAMGLFPAAITLAATDFDVLGLLASPRYQDGGPNTHSTTPVTFATALVLRLMGGGESTLVVLRLLHFALAAWALAILYRLVLPSFGRAGASFLCLAVLLHPTFSAQVGYLYLEVLLFLCAVAAIDAWLRGRFWPAALWSALAWTTKQTGGIVAAALAAATLLEQRPPRDKARRIFILLGLPALWTAAVAVLGRLAVKGSREYEGVIASQEAVFGGLWQYTQRFLLNVPDLAVYLLVFAVAASAAAPRLAGSLRQEPRDARNRKPDQHERVLAGLSGLSILAFLCLFLVALPAVADFTIVLPRYYVIVLPFLLLWTGLAVKWTAGRRVPSAAAGVFAIMAALFALNTNGALYPLDIDTEGPGNDPPLTERSNAYQRLVALQLEAMEVLQELPDVPVYYGHFEHFLFRYPDLGYARGPLPDGHNFNVESLSSLATAEPFPECVYALFNYPWLGGEKVLGLIRLAEARPDVTAEVVRELRDGRYVILLVRVQRVGAACPV